MQAMKRGFRGVFYSICLALNYWCAKTSQKMSNPRICWSWGRAAPIGREKAEFIREMHPKSLEGHIWYNDSLFSVKTNMICKRFLVFFVMSCFGSVEVSWAGENAGDTHLKKVGSTVVEGSASQFLFWPMWFANSKPLMQWTDVETARIRFRDVSPTCFGVFFWLNISTCDHAFALPNRYVP